MGRLSIDDTAALIMGMEALEELGRDQVAGFEPGEMVRAAWVRSTGVRAVRWDLVILCDQVISCEIR